MKQTRLGLVFCLLIVSVSCVIGDETTTAVTPTDPPTPPTPTPVDPKEYPPAGHYNVTTKDGKIACLDVTFALQLVIERTEVVNATHNKTITNYVSIRDASVNTTNPKYGCGDPAHKLETNTEITLPLIFNNTDKLTLTFKRTDPGFNNETSWLDSIDLEYQTNHPISIRHPLFNVTGSHKSYQCRSETSFDTTIEATPLVSVKVVFKEVKIDAFRSDVGTTNSISVCAADEDVSDMIPIAVGAALLALVVIVLVAYFIGRRRSRRLAYQSV